MLSELERRISDGLVRVVILFSAKKNSFIVGADLNMLYAVTDAKGALIYALFGIGAMSLTLMESLVQC